MYFWKMFCTTAERDLFCSMLDGDPRQRDCDTLLSTYVQICCPSRPNVQYCDADMEYANTFLFWLMLVVHDREEFERMKKCVVDFWDEVLG